MCRMINIWTQTRRLELSAQAAMFVGLRLGADARDRGLHAMSAALEAE